MDIQYCYSSLKDLVICSKMDHDCNKPDAGHHGPHFFSPMGKLKIKAKKSAGT